MSNIQFIYAIRNKVNEFVYIGKTGGDIYSRYAAHIVLLKKGKHPSAFLQKDFNSFGEDLFYVELIEKATQENVLEIERYWMDNFGKSGACYNSRTSYKNFSNLKLRHGLLYDFFTELSHSLPKLRRYI